MVSPVRVAAVAAMLMVALVPPRLPLMTAEPTASALIWPLASTLTRAGALLLQLIWPVTSTRVSSE
ncbi:hypothetical protein D3C73_627040 [compost metagenome]